MNELKISTICRLTLFCSLLLLASACSESERQREFREQALQFPAGITEMNANGAPAEDGENDPDDWRTAPDFSGLVDIETPAYPNPVNFNSQIEINVDLRVSDAVNGLYIYAFRQPSDLATTNALRVESETSAAGLRTFRISAAEFAQSGGTGNIDNIYRIIILNSRDEVISYGDVLVE